TNAKLKTRILLTLPQGLPEPECDAFQRMRFDLTDLRLFLDVHETGTITGGAQSSHEIVDAMRNDVCDIGVVSDWVDLEGLETFAFRPDPLVLVLVLVLVVPRNAALA